MIRQIKECELDTCLAVIHASFATVAADFHLTRENCPGHTSFLPIEKLQAQYAEHAPMFCYETDGTIVGYFSIIKNRNGYYELENLSVLPEYRHHGYGAEMIVYAKDKFRELCQPNILIGIIEENTILKNWYASLGFIHVGTKKFDNFPFTAGFMILNIDN